MLGIWYMFFLLRDILSCSHYPWQWASIELILGRSFKYLYFSEDFELRPQRLFIFSRYLFREQLYKSNNWFWPDILVFFLNLYCVKNELYVYGSTYGILLSHQKEQNDAIRSDIDGPRDCHTEWQLCQTKTNTIYCLYSEYKIKVEINLFIEK